MKIEEAIEILRAAVGCCSNDIEYEALETLVSALKEKESIRHGKLELIGEYLIADGSIVADMKYLCCGTIQRHYVYDKDGKYVFRGDYCPNCGAKMDGNGGVK